MLGEFLALLSAINWSLHMVFTKKAQKKAAQTANPLDPMMAIFITLLVNNVINFFVIIIRYCFWQPVQINSAGLTFLFFAGVLNSFVGRSMLFASVAMVGAAKAGLTKATSPVFVLLGGVLVLGERLGPWNWLGIGAVLLGLFLMSFDAARKDDIKLNTAGKRAGRLHLAKGITFGMGAAFFMGTGNIFRKAGVTEIPDAVLAVSLGSLFAILACFLVILIQGKGKLILPAIRNIEFNYAMSGVFASGALYSLVSALKILPVSIANSISATEALFTILLVWLMKEGKKENLGIQTFFFGVIIVTGTIILITK